MPKTLFDNVPPPNGADVPPCPFCGAEGIKAERDEDVEPGVALHWLECSNCGACGPVCSTADRARYEWTERYALEHTRWEVDRLSRELHNVRTAFDNYRIRVNSQYHDRRHGAEQVASANSKKRKTTT